MNNSQFGELLTQFNADFVWAGFKWMYVLAFGIYAAFAVIVMTQIKQMVAALSGGFDKSIILLGIIHVIVAVGALVLSIVVL